MQSQSDIDTVEDITGVIFQNKYDIFGRMAFGFIKNRYTETYG
jgi:hypothetical protein